MEKIKRSFNVMRGQVYYCNLKATEDEIGNSIQTGRKAVIVIQNDLGNTYSPVAQVIPCTTRNKSRLPCHIKLKLVKESITLIEQLRPVPINWIGNDYDQLRENYICTLSEEDMQRVERGIRIQFGLEPIPNKYEAAKLCRWDEVM